MKNIGVVLCDSGISNNQKKFVKVIDIGYGWKDENGHGTKVIDVMQKYCDTSIISIKILDKNNSCYLNNLIEALNACLYLTEKVICLPLSIDSNIYNNQIKKIINKLFKQGKVIVSSLHNKMNFSLPAGLPNVIGVKIVKRNSKLTKFYNSKNFIQCTLPVNLIIYKSLENEYSIFGGNSLACAFFTSHIVNILKNNKISKFKELENYLEKQFLSDLNFLHYKNSLLNYDNIFKNISKINLKLNIGNNITPFYNVFSDAEQLFAYLKELEKVGLHINAKTFLKLEDLENLNKLVQYFCLQGDNINEKI